MCLSLPKWVSLVLQKYKFLSRGSKAGCKLLTQIRVGRSKLNSHSFTVGKSPSPQCPCHFPNESVSHYFQDCFLYNEERRTLFGIFEHYIPKFVTFSKRKKLDIILNGFDKDNPEIYSTNVKLQIATQSYVLKTQRFEQRWKLESSILSFLHKSYHNSFVFLLPFFICATKHSS